MNGFFSIKRVNNYFLWYKDRHDTGERGVQKVRDTQKRQDRGQGLFNALAETINGLYKAEVIHQRAPWRSIEAVERATLEWVDWFNRRRLLTLIGNVPPSEAEAVYCDSLEELEMAA